MKRLQITEDQALPLEEQLVGINAKTAPYPAARSWSIKMPGIQCLTLAWS
jgi:putative transposase